MGLIIKVVGFLLLVVVTFFCSSHFYFLSDQNADNVTFTPASSLERTIKQVRFKINNVKVVSSNSAKVWDNGLIGKINRLSETFDKPEDMLLSVVDSNVPVIISNSVATQWNALKWDFWDLAMPEKWPVLSKVLSLDTTNEGTGVVFFTDNEKTEGGTLSTKCGDCSTKESPSVVSEMYLADFLYDLKNVSRKHFYSTNYRVVESIAKLEKDTTWQDFRIIEHSAIVANITVNLIAPQLSLLFPGAALQARYSEYHTMRVQLQGEGRYTLFAPDQLKNLYLYPSIHLSSQQSQVDARGDGVVKSFPRFARARSVAGTLQAGEVLYIPPYWTVHSEAPSTMSAMLDILSVSHEQLLLTPAFLHPLPFDKGQSRDERIVSAQIYLVHVLSRLKDLASVRKYALMLYSSRFESLFPIGGLFMQRSAFDCLQDDPAKYQSIVNSLDKARVMRAAEFVASALNDPSLPAAVKWLWMGDYVEQIGRWAMGDPEQTPLFLARCLHMDDKLVIEPDEVEGPSVVRMNPEL